MVQHKERRLFLIILCMVGAMMACTLPEAFPSLAYPSQTPPVLPTASALSGAVEPTSPPEDLPEGNLFSSAPAQPLSLGSAEEARSAVERGERYLNQYTTFSGETEIEPDVFQREALVGLDEYSQMLLSNNWCASTQESLEQNLKLMRLDFEVDGVFATETNIHSYAYAASDGWACTARLILLKDFSPGEHQVIRRIQINQALNDGETEFLPALHIDRVRVQVKPSEQLAAERADCAERIRNPLFKNLEGMQPAFCDTFDHNTGWWLNTTDGEMMLSTWSIVDGSLRVENTEKEVEKGFHYQVFPLVNNSFADFAASINGDRIAGTRGSAYGLLFRIRPDGGAFYYFYILDGKPTYGIDLYLDNEWTVIQATTISETINLNGRNQLAVIAAGAHFDCYINGIQVRSFDDDHLSSGGLGLGFSMAKAGESAAFTLDDFLVLSP